MAVRRSAFFYLCRDPLGTAKVEREESAPLSELTRELCADPVFAAKPISLELPDLIRLDYGEFEHAVPDALVKGLFRGFSGRQSDASFNSHARSSLPVFACHASSHRRA